MPAPDTQYYLDNSFEAQHIAGDTHYYWMEIAQDANEVVDAYREQKQNPEDMRAYWRGLADMGLYMESRYLDWRATEPAEKRFVSFMGLRSVPHMIGELARSTASFLAEDGAHTFDSKARAQIHERLRFNATIHLMRRTVNRAATDFAGRSLDDLISTQHGIDTRWQESRQRRQETIEQIRGQLDLQIETDLVYTVNADAPINLVHTKKVFAERRAQNRKVIKRSVQFLSKLIGAETTRVFVSGGAVRIEGRYAIYELKKASNLISSHGGFRALSVFDKEHPELHLCDICIYTDKVPLLDHVASIIMHIQAGEEEEILRIGNARNASDAAYNRDWLAPHLPKKYDDSTVFFTLDGLPPIEQSPTQLRRIDHLRRQVARTLFDEVMSDHVDLFVKCREAVEVTRPRFVMTNPADIPTLTTRLNANAA